MTKQVVVGIELMAELMTKHVVVGIETNSLPYALKILDLIFRPTVIKL